MVFCMDDLCRIRTFCELMEILSARRLLTPFSAFFSLPQNIKLYQEVSNVVNDITKMQCPMAQVKERKIFSQSLYSSFSSGCAPIQAVKSLKTLTYLFGALST